MQVANVSTQDTAQTNIGITWCLAIFYKTFTEKLKLVCISIIDAKINFGFSKN